MENLKAKLCQYKAELEQQHQELSELCESATCLDLPENSRDSSPREPALTETIDPWGSSGSTSIESPLREQACVHKSLLPVGESECVNNKDVCTLQQKPGNSPRLESGVNNTFNSVEKQTEEEPPGETPSLNICYLRSNTEESRSASTCLLHYAHGDFYTGNYSPYLVPLSIRCSQGRLNRALPSCHVDDSEANLEYICTKVADNSGQCGCTASDQCCIYGENALLELNDPSTIPLTDSFGSDIADNQRYSTCSTNRLIHFSDDFEKGRTSTMDITKGGGFGHHHPDGLEYGQFTNFSSQWQPDTAFSDENGIIWPMPEDLGSANYGFVTTGFNDSFTCRGEVGLGDEDLNSGGSFTVPGLQNESASVLAHKERLGMQKEMQGLQQGISKGRLEVKQLEAQLKENRSKAEEARTEVMLAEFKRDSARKELETVLQQIHQKRSQLRQIEEELEEEESSEEDRVKVTKDEMSQLMADREQLTNKLRGLEDKVKELEARERQRQELERQLSTAKDDLFTEQKKNRDQLESLREALNSKETRLKEIQEQRTSLYRELEQKDARLEEMSSEKEQLKKKTDKMESRYKQIENDKNQLIKEKSQEYEELKSRMQEQMVQSRANSSKESHELRGQLQQATEQLANVQANVNNKEEINLQLREQMLEIQQKLSEQIELKDAGKEEFDRRINVLAREQEETVHGLQKQADRDRTQAMEKLQQELLQQQQQCLAQQETEYKEELRKLQQLLNEGEVEVRVLQDKLRQQETVMKQVGDRIRSEAQDRFVQLIKEERTQWESDKEREVRQLLNSMREEMEKTSSRLREELGEERVTGEQQLKQITDLKRELEETKESSRLLYREKLAALNQAKENATLEKEREMDRMKERLEQETHKTIEKLRDVVNKQEEEIGRLKNEKIDIQTKDKQSTSQTEHIERAVLNEVNEEIRKISHVLGKSTYNGFNSWSSGVTQSGYFTRNALQSSLANLRASNEELRKYVQELKYEVEAQKQAMSKAEREKSESLEEQRKRMQQEKLHALESLKDRLIKEHLDEVDKLHKSMGRDKGMTKTLREKDKELREIQHNMTLWKDQTTVKLANKFQEELQKEVEKRTKDTKKMSRDFEREKTSQHREIERLGRELQRVSAQLRNQHSPTSSSPKRMASPNSSPRHHHHHSSNTNPNSSVTPVPFGTPPPHGNLSNSSAHTNLTIQRLQNQVRQLQGENLQLRRGGKPGGFMSNSLTDLSNLSLNETPVRDTNTKSSHQMELQNSQLESRAKLAEERATRNESLLNQKMVELSKLQGTLTQQTKELMQLERAYSQIQKGGVRPSSRVSFAT